MSVTRKRFRIEEAFLGEVAMSMPVAEGGDMLAERARENPRFLSGFTRVCEGGGVALYRKDLELANRK